MIGNLYEMQVVKYAKQKKYIQSENIYLKKIYITICLYLHFK